MLYELRTYDVMPGKQPALLDRFGSFTVKKWQEYGIRLVGFWTPEVGVSNNQIVYMWAWESFDERLAKLGVWQSSAERAAKWGETEKDGALVKCVNNTLLEPTPFSQMDNGIPYGPNPEGREPYMFELRTYEAVPGRSRDLERRFSDHTIHYFKKHGYRQVAYWRPVIGPSNQLLIYMLAWENYDERNRCNEAFQKDPEKEAAFAVSLASGPILERATNTVLRPTSFSPMK
ncbi:MAG: NIPSNAP family protein [Chloroflexota bacterium]